MKRKFFGLLSQLSKLTSKLNSSIALMKFFLFCHLKKKIWNTLFFFKSIRYKKGYDPIFGARASKRLIQKKIVNMLSTENLKGEVRGPPTMEATIKEYEGSSQVQYNILGCEENNSLVG